MSLRDEILEYQQPDLLVVPKNEVNGQERQDTTGNGLLYTSLYYILLYEHKELTEQDRQDFDRIVRSCMQEPGLLDRSKTKPEDQNSRDDYIGVCVASRLMQLAISHDICEYGKTHGPLWFKWYYKNTNEKSSLSVFFRAWFGRWIEVPALIQKCAFYKPNIFRRLYVFFKLLTSSVNDDVSCLINSLICIAFRRQSHLMDFSIMLYQIRLHKKHENGLKSVLERLLEPQHPIAKYWINNT